MRAVVLLLSLCALLQCCVWPVLSAHPPQSLSGRPIHSLEEYDPSLPVFGLSEAEILARQPHIDEEYQRGAETGIILSLTPDVLPDIASVSIYVEKLPTTWNCTADYVTLSCGPTNGPRDNLDVLPLNCTQFSGEQICWTNIAGLVGLRCDYLFTYVHVAAGGEHQALANATAKMAADWKSPAQVHTAFADAPDQMWVSWVSSSDAEVPLVHYALQSGGPYSEAKGLSKTYGADSFCGMPANVTSQLWFRDPGYFHHVLLTGLTPATKYFYKVGSDAEGWSPEYSITTARPAVPLPAIGGGAIDQAPSAVDPVKFLVYADHGVIWAACQQTTARVLEEMQAGFNDFILHFGDIAYGTGVGWRWDAYGTMMQPIMATTPYMTSIGNHEYDHVINMNGNDPSGVTTENGWVPSWGDYAHDGLYGDSNGECGVATVARYKSPSNGNGLFWYSFDFAHVHVVQLSSEHDYTAGSVQRLWLEADLKSVDRNKTAFVVITMHRQMYTSMCDGSPCLHGTEFVMSEHMQTELEPLFIATGVNLVLNGHQHCYERSCPVYAQQCVSSGAAPVYLIIGTAGAAISNGGFNGSWSLVQSEEYGIARVTATEEVLTLEFILNDQPAKPFDTITLKPYDGVAAARAVGVDVEAVLGQQELSPDEAMRTPAVATE